MAWERRRPRLRAREGHDSQDRQARTLAIRGSAGNKARMIGV